MNRVLRLASTAATMPVAVSATAAVAVPVSATAAVAVTVSATAAVWPWRCRFGGAPTAGLEAVGQRPLGRLPCTWPMASASRRLGSSGLWSVGGFGREFS